MSSFNLGKKLKPTSKAWKSLVKNLMNLSQAVKRKTLQLKSLRPIQRFVHLRKRHLRKSPGAIYVDQLFGGPVPLHVNHQVTLKQVTTSSTSEDANIGDKITLNPKGREFEKANSVKGKFIETAPRTLADVWDNISLSSLPKLHRNIDEKAEEFISKFWEDMKMQKEKSFLDFQEMLARSS